MMRPSRARAWLIVVATVCSPRVASGAVDMGGAWGVRSAVQFSNITGFADWHVDQVGNAITINGTLTGSVDPDTGDFFASGDSGQPCGTSSVSGTVIGTRFTATANTEVEFHGTCLVLPTSADGRRCGNGVVDPGEVCDDHDFDDGDCCDSTCQIQRPAGAACLQPGHLPGDESCRPSACSPSGTCETTSIAPDGTPCDDDVFCDGADQCSAGLCSRHAGDPCAAGPVCQDACNEAAQSCLAPSAAPCPDDANACTSDVCDGAGGCTHPARAHGTPCPDDGHACTLDYCDGAAACVHTPSPSSIVCRPAASPCDVAERCDGTDVDCPADVVVPAGARGLCAPCASCDAGGACVFAPQTAPACTPPAKSALGVVDRTRDSITWTWTGPVGGVDDFGTPDSGPGAYALCVYDPTGPSGADSVYMRMPSGGTCGGRPCWRRARKAFRYRDRAGASDGVTALDLAVAGTGRGRLAVKSGAAATHFPGLPASLPLVVQLQAADPSRCWEASYSDARTNAPTALKARTP